MPEPLTNPFEHLDASPRKRSKRHDLEAAVQRECLQWLGKQDLVIYVERRNTGAIAFEDGSRVAFGRTGAADIWCLLRRRNMNTCPIHIEIECKRRDGKGRLSQAQEKFKQKCDRDGVPYLVVTSAEDLAEKLFARGLLTS